MAFIKFCHLERRNHLRNVLIFASFSPVIFPSCLKGYVNNSLSFFDLSELGMGKSGYCRYLPRMYLSFLLAFCHAISSLLHVKQLI